MKKEKVLSKQRWRRRNRVRKKLRGTAEQPRLCVYRSLKHISCQLIDDLAGVTLVSAGTRDKDLRGEIKYGGNKDAALIVGKALAERALAKGIKKTQLDRGHNKYHGRVSALADAAREAGLSF